MKFKSNRTHNFGSTVASMPQRSSFRRAPVITTAFSAGDLIPLMIDEVYPGDNIKGNIRGLIRQSTIIKPVMDMSFIDVYAFFVPYRLVMDKLKEFFGENDDPWAQKTEYIIPQVKAPKDGWSIGTIADYMAFPTNISDIEFSALPFRSYAKIVNDWFRDQNLQTAAHINLGQTLTEGSNGSEYVKDLEKGGKPFIVNKYHDYFTSALVAPQKGQPVVLPLGNQAPVYAGFDENKPIGSRGANSLRLAEGVNSATNQWRHSGNNAAVGYDAPSNAIGLSLSPGGNYDTPAIPTNLYADMAQTLGIPVNDVRLAFAYQQYLEKDARGGTRYVEFILNHFGVNSDDARQQRSEFLGGSHNPLNIRTVPQTSASDDKSPQGNLAAFGETQFQSEHISKTFQEHGILMVLGVVRYKHSYQQGLNRSWTRKNKLDFYNPTFAHIGEQPIYQYEIRATGDSSVDNRVFGFNEAWADLRYKPNLITGVMRSNAALTLDYYHYADKYDKPVSLSPDWLKEDKSNIDRTLAVKSSDGTPQYQANFFFDFVWERPLPVHSIPGLKRL